MPSASEQWMQIANHLSCVVKLWWGRNFNLSEGIDSCDVDEDNEAEGTDEDDETRETDEDDETRDTDEDEEDVEMEMEDSEHDYEVTIARYGNGVISAWEHLAEHFLCEAASIGRKPFLHTKYMYLTCSAASQSQHANDLTVTKLFAFKLQTGITNRAFDLLPHILSDRDFSSWKVTWSRIQYLSGIQPICYDCCLNSCICYTAQYENLDNCPSCGTTQVKDGKAQKYFEYLPLIPCLCSMMVNSRLAAAMCYRAEHQLDPNSITDIFNSQLYHTDGYHSWTQEAARF